MFHISQIITHHKIIVGKQYFTLLAIHKPFRNIETNVNLLQSITVPIHKESLQFAASEIKTQATRTVGLIEL